MSIRPADVLRSLTRLSTRERHVIAARVAEAADRDEGADKISALRDAVGLLDTIGAPYALIGGVAVGVHSEVPRATADTDLALHTSWRGARLNDVLAGAGFTLLGDHAHSVNFKHSSGEPLQLAFDLEFDAMIGRAESFDLDGTAVRVVTKDDLIAKKRRAAADPSQRPSRALRHRADVAMLLGDVGDEHEGW